MLGWTGMSLKQYLYSGTSFSGCGAEFFPNSIQVRFGLANGELEIHPWSGIYVPNGLRQPVKRMTTQALAYIYPLE